MADIKPIKLSPLGTLSNAKPGDVIPVEHGGTGVTDLGLILDSVLPDQSGNTNRVLTTNGTAASWSDINADVITTGTLSNARTSGTSANTPSALVLRDGSGNFAAGTITATSITLAANPTSALQAATKQYVDAVQQGLLTKPAVKSATTTDLGATYNNGSSGVGATLTIPATATLTISNVSTWNLNDGILVKDQTSTSQNGRYVVTQIGNASTTWILTRCSLCDQADEIPGAYMFVTDGDYTNSGFVLSVDTPDTFVVGTDAISVYLFTGAASYMPGTGINVTGNTISLQYAPASTNTASTLVLRDGSGNFSAGTITATLSGNASTSTALQTARTLTIGSTGKTFDGTGDVSWSLGEIGAQAAGNYVTTDTTQTITGAKTFSATLTATSNVRTNNGTAALPSYSFNTDSGVGMYRPDTNTLAFSTSGTEACRISDTGRLLVGTTTDDGSNKLQLTGNAAISGRCRTWIGSVGQPAYSFIDDPDTGMYSPADNVLALVTGGVSRLTLGTSTATSSLLWLAPSGSAAAPSYSFSTNTGVGMYRPAADTLAFSTSGAERFRVSAAGNLLIGTTTDDGISKLQVSGEAFAWRIKVNDGSAGAPSLSFGSDTNTGIYRSASDQLTVTTGGTAAATFYANGSFTAAGDVTAYSDKRLKKDLVVIPNALDKIQQLTGYTYERIDTGVHQAGLIAQDVQAVLPEVVDASGDYLAIAYGNLAGLFVEAIKDLRAENAALKAELQCIKEQLK